MFFVWLCSIANVHLFYFSCLLVKIIEALTLNIFLTLVNWVIDGAKINVSCHFVLKL